MPTRYQSPTRPGKDTYEQHRREFDKDMKYKKGGNLRHTLPQLDTEKLKKVLVARRWHQRRPIGPWLNSSHARLFHHRTGCRRCRGHVGWFRVHATTDRRCQTSAATENGGSLFAELLTEQQGKTSTS